MMRPPTKPRAKKENTSSNLPSSFSSSSAQRATPYTSSSSSSAAAAPSKSKTTSSKALSSASHNPPKMLKSHADLVETSLLSLHRDYFVDCSHDRPAAVTSQGPCSLLALLRDSGSLHAPTSTFCVSDVLRLSLSSISSLASSYAAALQSPAALDKPALDHETLYAALEAAASLAYKPAIASRVTPRAGGGHESRTTGKGLPKKDTKSDKGGKKAAAAAAVAVDKEKDDQGAADRGGIHNFIDDFLLPLNVKREQQQQHHHDAPPPPPSSASALPSLALSTDIISHPLTLLSLAQREEVLQSVFIHFSTIKTIILCPSPSHPQRHTQHEVRTMDASEFECFMSMLFGASPSQIQDDFAPLFDCTVEASNFLTPHNLRSLTLDASTTDGAAPPSDSTSSSPPSPSALTYFAFLEVLVLLTLTKCPSNVPDSETAPTISKTLLSLIDSIQERMFVSTCEVYASSSLSAPLLSRFLALLRDAAVLDSRLAYHEAARVFLDRQRDYEAAVAEKQQKGSRYAGRPLPSTDQDLFADLLFKCIPTLGSCLPERGGAAYVVDSIRAIFFKTCPMPRKVAIHQRSMIVVPDSLSLPMCNPDLLQHLAQGALSPLRYVFLRYGGFLPDRIEACANEVITSSWQKAIKGDSPIMLTFEAFSEFCTHFNIVGNVIDLLTLRGHVENVLRPVAVRRQNRNHSTNGGRSASSFSTSSSPLHHSSSSLSASALSFALSFPHFLDVLADIACVHFSRGAMVGFSNHVELFNELLRVMDPNMIMFMAQPSVSMADGVGVSEGNLDTDGHSSIATLEFDGFTAPREGNPFDSPLHDSESFHSDFGGNRSTGATIQSSNPHMPWFGSGAMPTSNLVTFDVRRFTDSLPFCDSLEKLFDNLTRMEIKLASAYNQHTLPSTVKQSGISRKTILSFLMHSKIAASSRITVAKIVSALNSAESLQRTLDARVGSSKTRVTHSHDQPTKAFARNTVKPNPQASTRERAKPHRKSIDESCLFGAVPFFYFLCRIAISRCGVSSRTDGHEYIYFGEDRSAKKALAVLEDECFPEGFAAFGERVCESMIATSNSKVENFFLIDEVFHPDIVQALADNDDAIRLAFAVGIAAFPVAVSTEVISLRCPALRTTAVESMDCKIKGDVALTLLSSVGLSGSTPFDDFAALIWAVGDGGISASEVSLSLSQFAFLAAKVALLEVNDGKKATKVLQAALASLNVMSARTQPDQQAIMLLLDADAPLTALSGGNDELKHIFGNPPKFIIGSKKVDGSGRADGDVWGFSDMCILARAAGLLVNNFNFSHFLDAFEAALAIHGPDLIRNERHLSAAWVARINRGVSREIFCTFWRIVSVRWASKTDVGLVGENACLSYVLRRRIFPVLSSDENVVTTLIKTAVYDGMSIGLIRHHESALEALFSRYAKATVDSIELSMGDWSDYRTRADNSSRVGDEKTSVWATKSFSKTLGMDESSWMEFAVDLNLLPGLIPINILRSIFKECSAWPSFALIHDDASPIARVRPVGTPISFVGFVEGLLRCGTLLQLADIERQNGDRTRDGRDSSLSSSPSQSSKPPPPSEAHIDVLFNCMDTDGAIFFKSKVRANNFSPVKRGVGLGPGVDDFDALLKVLGTPLVFFEAQVSSVQATPGSFNGEVVFTLEDTLEVIVRLNLGSVGLPNVLDSWQAMASGREYILAGEVAILVKKMVAIFVAPSVSDGFGDSGWFFRFLDTQVGSALEQALSDSITYEGLRTPKCGPVLSCENFWRASTDMTKAWERCVRAERNTIVVGKHNGSTTTVMIECAEVAKAADFLSTALAASGLISVSNVHEVCGLAVATLAGSSSLRTRSEGDRNEPAILFTRIQFDWCVGRIADLCCSDMAFESGGGEAAAAEMLQVIVGLLSSAVDDEKGVGEGSAKETASAQIALIFDAYATEYDNNVGERDKMIDEQSFIQLLMDLKLIQVAESGQQLTASDKIERVKAIELFRMSISPRSRSKFFIQHQNAICDAACIEDFYNCFDCLALLLEPEGSKDNALQTLLSRLELF